MRVVALCSAQHFAETATEAECSLRALLPLAGMTLIEHQAERASAMGVSRLWLLVDAVPPALAAACDRIRARGMPIELMRTSADILLSAGEGDALLLVADGLIADAAHWQAIADSAVSSLLTVTETAAADAFERIDAGDRWAGLAWLPAAALARLAEAPDDWDPQLTLLRQAVQAGAARVPCDPGHIVRGDVAIGDSARAVAIIAERMMAASVQVEPGIAQNWALGPLVRLCGPRLLSFENSGPVARLTALAASLLALAALGTGRLAWCIGAAFVASGARSVAKFVGAHRHESAPWRWSGQADVILQACVLAAFGWATVPQSTTSWLPYSATLPLLPFVLFADGGGRRAGIGGPGRWIPGSFLDLPMIWLAVAALLPLLTMFDIVMLLMLAIFVSLGGNAVYRSRPWGGDQQKKSV